MTKISISLINVIPLSIAKLSGLELLSLDFSKSLLLIEMSMQFFASEMQADNNVLGKSNEAASAQMLSCDFMTVKNL